jgi:hypothetical protein
MQSRNLWRQGFVEGKNASRSGVVRSPPFDDDGCLMQRVEDFAVEEFVARTQLSIGLLSPGVASPDIGGPGADVTVCEWNIGADARLA